MAEQGLIKLASLTGFVGASMSRSWGSSPDIGSITVSKDSDLPATVVSSLTIDFDGSVRTFPKCRLVQTQQNNVERLFSIEDERWTWRRRRISGSYNVRDEHDRIVTVTETSARAIAEELLGELPISGFDVLALPDDKPGPYFELEDSEVAPVLEKLFAMYGCALVLDYESKVTAWKIGQGAPLPVGGEIQTDQRLSITDRAEKFEAALAPTRYVLRLNTEPVGEDLDGSIKNIDDLTYKPAAGWDTINSALQDWGHVSEPDRGRARYLAEKCVYRWFRVTKQATYEHLSVEHGHTADIPILGEKITDIGQILPLIDIHRVGGQRIKAVTAPGALPLGAEIPQSEWTTDLGRGLVIFRERQIRVIPHTNIEEYDPIQEYTFENADAAGNVIPHDTLPADIWAYATFNFRTDRSQPHKRFVREVAGLGPVGAGTELVPLPEIFRLVYFEYKTFNPFDASPPQTNDDEITALADKAINLEKEAQGPIDPVGETKTYPRLVFPEINGKVRQVSWRAGYSQAATTTASQDTEHVGEHGSYLQRYRESLARQTRNRQGSIRKFAGTPKLQEALKLTPYDPSKP